MPTPALTLIAACPRPSRSPAEQSFVLLAEAARRLGIPTIETGWIWQAEDLDPALERICETAGLGRVLFSGPWLGLAAQRELEAKVSEYGGRLISSADDSNRAMKFALHKDSLEGLGARSVICQGPEDLERALDWLGEDLFVKGPVKSLKEEGAHSCLVHGRAELEKAWEALKRNGHAGPLIVKERLDLRCPPANSSHGLPEAREWRHYLVDGEWIGSGPYWRSPDHFGPLKSADVCAQKEIAAEVARRTKLPLLAVDVGQEVSGRWRLIEIGDSQFSGICHLSHELYLSRSIAIEREALSRTVSAL